MAFFTNDWKGTQYFPIHGFHHVEFFVGNAKQAAHYYRSLFGFRPLAYSGPETGNRARVSYVLEQGDARFIFTTPLSSSDPASAWIQKHGDGIADVAFSVTDPADAHRSCLSRGALNAIEPVTLKDKDGTWSRAAIKAYGDTIHSLVDSAQYDGAWAPGFIPLSLPKIPGGDPKVLEIDHVVANVGWGEMDKWTSYYDRIFGFPTFVHFDQDDISTQFSSLKSKVVRSENWKVKLPINEPAKGKRKSQIEEFLDFYEGPGVQHVALRTNDLIHTIGTLRDNGATFLSVPDSYYEALPARVGRIAENLDEIKRLGILADREAGGYLLQLFTQPLEDRPTLFFEFIQRAGSKGFGQGNFQALFESIEREQERRGNL